MDEARRVADDFILGSPDFSLLRIDDIASQLTAARFHRRRNDTNQEDA
jgi:hypothetical protein